MIISSEPPTSLLTEIQKHGYKKVQDIALENKGIIFGGYVRDKIISEHYTKQYLQKMNNIVIYANEFDDPYWDVENDPETSHRLLLPNDMDVCFYSQSDVDMFIAKLRTVKDFDSIIVNDMTNISSYSSPIIENVRRVIVCLKIGKIPFICPGKIVILSIDVVVPVKNIALQPPFSNLDMLCNGFILTDKGISLSNNTGTVIDSYNYFDKTMASAQIIKDMVDFNTYLCFSPTSYNNINIVAVQRIKKMEENKWSFLNMPFITKTFTKEDDPNDCCICRELFKEGDKTANTTSTNKEGHKINSVKMHYGCCMKYIYHQKNSNIDAKPHDTFTFHCPARNIIDFGGCNRDIRDICK